MFSSVLNSPIGNLIIESDGLSITFIGFRESPEDENPDQLSDIAKQQLKSYFEGKSVNFSFPISQPGTTFQKAVWHELLNIPAGKPISYLSLSKKMNNPLAIRAIASANGKNNLMIVVPCHRVIGSNGDLVGYAGGLWRKKWLLEHEAKFTGNGQSVLDL